MKNFTGSIWSEDEEENPGMHKNYKVYVPYCTSDIYSGRKDADEVSAGFAFHGKFVVEAVVDDLLSNGYALYNVHDELCDNGHGFIHITATIFGAVGQVQQARRSLRQQQRPTQRTRRLFRQRLRFL